MATIRAASCVIAAFAATLVLPAAAQTTPQASFAAGLGNLGSVALAGNRSYLGLNMGHSSQHLPCGSMTLLCDDTDRPLRLYGGAMVGNFWGLELGYLDTGDGRPGGLPGAQGLNFSLVGKAPLGNAFGVYGKVGTTLGRPDTSVMGAKGISALGRERGFGLSYGAGVSLSFTPRLSATLEWENNDFRFAGSVGDPVRSTSLGLRYRY